MKKYYVYCFALLLTESTAFPQQYLLKSELLPDQPNRDSRFTVQATVMDNDTWCTVTWPDTDNNSQELAYDDGEADDFFLYATAGSLNANKFHTTDYPFIVTGGRIYVGDGSFPGPFLGTSFQVFVFDDDGEEGLPGTPLDSLTVTVDNYGWVEFEGLTATITEGDFYLAMKQTAPSPNTAPVGVDSDNPTYNISYTRYNDNEWAPAPVQDFMIRAWKVGYERPSRNIDYFQLVRFSGFDPDISPLLGETTILDTIDVSGFEDYEWINLPPGWYAYGVKTHYTGGDWSDYDVSNVVSHSLNFYTPSCFYQADTGNRPLILCPPMDSTGSVPAEFMGFNLYLDSVLIAFIPPLTTSYDPEWPSPANITFELTALYDLTVFGYPDEIGESLILPASYWKRYGFNLPFLEQWNSATFETNNWTTDGPNWSIKAETGNPFPSTGFTWDPPLVNYESSLTSYPFLADSMTEGYLYLDFDIKLSSVNTTGNEFLFIQAWNWENQEWITIKTFSNLDGSFDWVSEHIYIPQIALTQVFKIRFTASGDNTLNILGWLVDNIKVYRECNPPTDLTAYAYWNGIHLNWEQPIGGSIDEWISWDDGLNYENIGTGGAVEFDVAQRWEPDQLLDYEGASVTEISFFPMEQTATYNVRVWKGDGPSELVYDQAVTTIEGQWNTITLLAPVPIDITQELWVGYYVNTPTGYPAGTDNGPAINGYGNMMNFGGWQTLLEINPDLDYNWNIRAHIEKNKANKPEPKDLYKYAIYRSNNGDPYFLRDYSIQNEYLDDSLGKGFWCYYVTALYISETDACESSSSNEACDFVGINEVVPESGLKFFPIPANDFIKIESSEEIKIISFYNSFGELILKNKVDERRVEIPVSDYPTGVYMIRVEAGKEMISKKVMVVH